MVINNRALSLLCAGLFLACWSAIGNVQAAEPNDGNVPKSMLAELGMGDMKPMAEAEAKQVRGKFIIDPSRVPQISFSLPALVMQLNAAATARVSSAIENSPLGPYVDFNPSGFLLP